MDRYNFAIIGCGRISTKHLDAISKLENANLVAVCDIDTDKAKRVGESSGNVPFFSDYHQMMERIHAIDIVNVLVPSGLHGKVVIDLAKYKKTIIVEKPMALRIDDALAMSAACKENKVKLFVIYQNRYNKAVIAAKKAFDEGSLGKPLLVTSRVRWCRHQDYFETDNWHGTWSLDGGVISQQATHHLDLLTYFGGSPEQVICHTQTQLLNIEVEDTALAIIKLKSGALASFEATTAARPYNIEGSLSLLGSKGHIVIGGVAVNEIEQCSVKIDDDSKYEAVCNVYGNGHLSNIKDVLNLLGGSKSSMLCTAEQGIKNVELLTSLYESAAQGSIWLTAPTTQVKSKLGL